MQHLPAAVAELRGKGAHFRNDIVTGVGVRQILIEDPSGNPVEVPGHAAHSEHDADPGFQEFNRRADLLQPEDPLVYGGEVLHAV